MTVNTIKCLTLQDVKFLNALPVSSNQNAVVIITNLFLTLVWNTLGKVCFHGMNIFHASGLNGIFLVNPFKDITML